MGQVMEACVCCALQLGLTYSARYLGHTSVQADAGSGPHPTTSVDVLAIEIRMEDHVNVVVYASVEIQQT